MPVNGFTVGRDVSLDIVGLNGPIRFSLITGFNARPDTTDVKVKGLDGKTRHVMFPDGWTGTFDVERQDSTVDDIFAQLESNFYSGLNLPAISIMETITEVSGAVTQYRFTDVILRLDDAGAYAGDQTVKQRLSFMASRRMKVA